MIVVPIVIVADGAAGNNMANNAGLLRRCIRRALRDSDKETAYLASFGIRNVTVVSEGFFVKQHSSKRRKKKPE